MKLASFIDDLPIDAYHRRPELGSSNLKEALRSPLHMAESLKQGNEPSKAMRIGSAVDCLLLEPGLFEQRFVVAPEFKGAGARGNRQAFLNQFSFHTVLTEEEHAESYEIADSVRRSDLGRELLQGGVAQLSGFWTDEATGIECKCRPDYLRSDIIVDLKTAADGSPAGFAKAAANFKYHLQAAHYIEGIARVRNRGLRFIFLVVENEAPYAVSAYELGPEDLALGVRLRERALTKIKNATLDPMLLGYSARVEYLHLPPWAFKEDE